MRGPLFGLFLGICVGVTSLFVLNACGPDKLEIKEITDNGNQKPDPDNCKQGNSCKPTGDKVNRTAYKNCNKVTPPNFSVYNRWKVVFEYKAGISVETLIQIAETNITLTTTCRKGNQVNLSTWVNVPSEVVNGRLSILRSESRTVETTTQDGSKIICPASLLTEVKSLTFKGECLQISDVNGQNPVLYTLGN